MYLDFLGISWAWVYAVQNQDRLKGVLKTELAWIKSLHAAILYHFINQVIYCGMGISFLVDLGSVVVN